MFVDSVKFQISSGKGGAGCTSFRREKHVLLGGPDGGDGGNGGDVYFKVDNNTNTLVFYKGKTKLVAQNGFPGEGRKKSGKKGSDLYLVVPPGTAVYDDESGELLFDMINDGEIKLFLKGGKGGLGNTHFKNSVNQRPEYSQPGLAGESLTVRLELKLIADVGLVGFPNVGKSTLISTISNAKPQIANYEFTTLTPKLGRVEIDEYSGFVMADIPGIIEGASDGKGLGLDFLQHIERTEILLFMVDLANYRDIATQFKALQKEILKFSSKMKDKVYAIALTKMDAIGEYAETKATEFAREFDFEKRQNFDELDPTKSAFIIPISAVTNQNISELKFLLSELVKVIKKDEA